MPTTTNLYGHSSASEIRKCRDPTDFSIFKTQLDSVVFQKLVIPRIKGKGGILDNPRGTWG